MHEDESSDLKEVGRIFEDILDILNVPLNVRKLMVNVCDIVTRCATRLAAARIMGIIKKIGRDGTGGISGGRVRGMDEQMRRTVLAVEGGLYTSYSVFREYLNEAMAKILGEEIAPHVILKVMEDGSGIGGALVAASHSYTSSVNSSSSN